VSLLFMVSSVLTTWILSFDVAVTATERYFAMEVLFGGLVTMVVGGFLSRVGAAF
jgi:hypothetical protein